MSTFTLPMPPSTNNLFVNRSKGGRFPSQKYADWIQEAGWELKRQRPAKVAGKVAVLFEFGKPDKRKRDLDNRLKAPLDLLVEHGVIEADDDSIVVDVRAISVPEVFGVRVTIAQLT